MAIKYFKHEPLGLFTFCMEAAILGHVTCDLTFTGVTMPHGQPCFLHTMEILAIIPGKIQENIFKLSGTPKY